MDRADVIDRAGIAVGADCTCDQCVARRLLLQTFEADQAVESKLSSCLEGQEALKAQTVRIRKALAGDGHDPGEGVDTEALAIDLVGRLDSCRRNAIDECWKEIDKHIPRGTLASIYENESRNGMILATNILFRLLHPDAPHAEFAESVVERQLPRCERNAACIIAAGHDGDCETPI